MGLNETAEELVEDFNLFEDWSDKYEYIISLGKELSAMKKEDKTEENLVKGCQSQVWLVAKELVKLLASVYPVFLLCNLCTMLITGFTFGSCPSKDVATIETLIFPFKFSSSMEPKINSASGDTSALILFAI